MWIADRSRAICAGVLVVPLSAVVSCSEFSEQSVENGQTLTVFDDRLPQAWEELWETCHQEFLIEADDEILDLRGSCTAPDDLESSSGQLLFFMLSTDPEVPLTIPNVLYEERSGFDGFSWPLQNCYVRIDTEVYFRSISFETVSAEWTYRGSSPAFKVELENPRFGVDDIQRWAPVTRSTIAAADCPSLLNEIILEEKLDNSGIDGIHDIRLRDMDFTVYIKFRIVGRITDGVYSNSLCGEVDVVASLDADDDALGIDWDRLPDKVREEFEGSIDLMEDELESMLVGELGDLGDRVADEIQATLPANENICSLLVNDGAFEIRTAVTCPGTTEPMLEVGTPDLTVAITDRRITQAMLPSGDVSNATLTRVSFAVTNEGGFPAPASQIVLKRHSLERARLTVPARTAYPALGSTYSGSFEDLNEELFGSNIEWTVEIDPENDITESNERNNTDSFQTSYTSPDPPEETRPGRRFSAAERRALRLAKELSLTEEQQRRVLQIFEQEVDSARVLAADVTLPVPPDQRRDLEASMRAIRVSSEEQLKGVLTEGQLATLRALDERQRRR